MADPVPGLPPAGLDPDLIARPSWILLPWWERVMQRLIPDARGWLALWAAILVLMLLQMIRENPALLANASFMQFAGVLAGGTFLVLFPHYFGGTKVGGDVMVANSKTVTEGAKTGTGSGAPTPVVIQQPPDKPVPVDDQGSADPSRIVP